MNRMIDDPAASVPPPLPVQPLSYNAPFAVSPAEVSADERNMAMLCHLLGIFTGFLGPLIIWLVKKDTSTFVDAHGKQSLNFQLSLLIYSFVCAFFALFCIGIFLMMGLIIAAVVFEITACVQASRGNLYEYPLSIRLVR